MQYRMHFAIQLFKQDKKTRIKTLPLRRLIEMTTKFNQVNNKNIHDQLLENESCKI